MPGQLTLADQLAAQERVWGRRPLLRRLYGEWFELIAQHLSHAEGPTIELGSGFGALRERLPQLVTTDVEPTPWADEIVDAQRLPWDDASLANIVGLDVIHHLANPRSFLDEAQRVLRPGGRVVLVEPYTSPLSTLAYRRYHHEQTDTTADAFSTDKRLAADAMEGNQAVPMLMFFRHDDVLRREWPTLELVGRRRFSFFLYPLSGGYSRAPLVPAALYRPLAAVERLLAPLAPLAAFRCLVVLERRGRP